MTQWGNRSWVHGINSNRALSPYLSHKMSEGNPKKPLEVDACSRSFDLIVYRSNKLRGLGDPQVLDEAVQDRFLYILIQEPTQHSVYN